jgi:hypothetical protein
MTAINDKNITFRKDTSELKQRIIDDGSQGVFVFLSIINASRCPECAAEIGEHDRECDNCGLPFMDVLEEVSKELGLIKKENNDAE